MSKRSVLATLKDFTSGKGKILHMILEGDILNNTKQALAAFVFKDHEGNAVFPTLNPDGTIPTSSQSGKPFAAHVQHLIASQTQDIEAVALSIDLEVDGDEVVRYTKPDFKASSFSECKIVMDLIVDEGLGSEAITELGYGLTSDAFTNDKQKITNNFVDVPVAATTAKLRLKVTPYESGNQADDVLLSASINKIPVQTP
jgi:hypothetical protein